MGLSYRSNCDGNDCGLEKSRVAIKKFVLKRKKGINTQQFVDGMLTKTFKGDLTELQPSTLTN